MITFFRSRTNLLLFILVASITIQFIFFSFLSSPEERNQNTDYWTFYKPVAINIMRGNGIIDTHGNIATRYPPGFSLILAPVLRLSDYLDLDELQLITLFNVLITAVNCLLISLIGEIVFNIRVGLISALIWITYPFNLWLIKHPNSELPFMFLCFLGILMFIYALRTNRLLFVFFVGATLALSALIRPISLMLNVVFILMLILFRRISVSRRIASILLLLAGFVITVLPWEYHVYSKTGDIILLSTGGTPSIKDGLQFAIRPTVSNVRAEIPDDVMEFMIRVKDNNDQLKTSGDVLDFVALEFKKNPATVLKLYFIKIVRSWYATSQMWHENYILPIQVFYLALSITGIILALRSYKEQTLFVLFFIAIVFYFWGMTVVVMSILRYMVPAMGLLLIFAAIPVDRLLSRQRLYQKYVKGTNQ